MVYDGHDDALNVFSQANKADPANPTAVVAWMGYELPTVSATSDGSPHHGWLTKAARL